MSDKPKKGDRDAEIEGVRHVMDALDATKKRYAPPTDKEMHDHAARIEANHPHVSATWFRHLDGSVRIIVSSKEPPIVSPEEMDRILNEQPIRKATRGADEPETPA